MNGGTNEETIRIGLDTGPIAANAQNANRNIESIEKTAVRVTTRSTNSIRQIVERAERQAAFAGKTGIDRLIAERDLTIKKLAGEEQAVRRVTAAYDKMIAAATPKQQSQSIWSQLSSGGGIQGMLSQISGAGVAFASAAAGAGALAYQWFNLASAQAATAESIVNLADKTGMAVGQVDRLQAMSKIANVNVESLAMASKTLAVGLQDTEGEGSKAWRALQELGVSTVDVTGKQRDFSQVTLDVLDRLGGVENSAKRMALANALLGRGAIELMPLIRNYGELDKTVRGLGFGTRDNLVKALAEADDKLDALGLQWDILKGKLSKPLTVVVDVLLNLPDIVKSQVYGPAFVMTSALGDPRKAAMDKETAELKAYSQRILAQRAAATADRARAAVMADPQNRLNDVNKKLGDAQGKWLSGDEGAGADWKKLKFEKATLERMIEASKESVQKAKDLVKWRDKLRTELGKLRIATVSSQTGGGSVLSTEDLLALAQYEKQLSMVKPFDPIASQGQVADRAIEEYAELSKVQKEQSDLAANAVKEQEDAYGSMFNRLRSGFESTFDSLVRGGADAAAALRTLFLSALLTPIKQAASQMFAQLFMPLMGGKAAGGGGSFGGSSSSGGLGSFASTGLGMAGMLGPGGTAPFVGNYGGGAAGAGGGGAGSMGLFGGLGGLSAAKIGGMSAAGLGGAVAGGGALGMLGAWKAGKSDKLGWKIAAPAIGAVSGMAALGGLMAMFPALVAMGPAGWIAAAGIGAAVGLVSIFKRGAEDKARKKIKSYYGVDVADKSFLKMIVSIAKQSYGGNLDIAIRSRDVRDMIELYAMSTGQKMSALDNVARGVNLSQIGGSLYQTGSYSNGVGYSYGGAIQGIGGLSTFASTTSSSPVVLDREGTQDFLTGMFETGIVENPRAVQKASNIATNQNYGRTAAAVNLTDPLGVTI